MAGVHGEEPETVWLARRLLERVDAGEATMAIIACANPDGVADSVRQNAIGVDLNRNYPSASWLPDDSYTYPPGTAREARQREQPHLALRARRDAGLRARDAGACSTWWSASARR